MELKPPAALMLGMVRIGARSGYAIKRVADVSTRFFWPTSMAQVYPELARLEDAGLLTRREDHKGARTRFAYELSPAGEAALIDWLRSPEEPTIQIRDEGLLRLFFADVLPPDDQLALVRLLRRQAESAAAEIEKQIEPYAEGLEGSGRSFPTLVARFGADSYAHAAEWLSRLEAELEASGTDG